MPLGSTQLNAKASVPGAFAYNPSAGTVLAAGTHTLMATFTPADAAAYTTATKSVTLQVTSTGTFKGPASGGGWSGRVSGGNLLYNGQTYPIVNGRVKFPDCTTYIVAPDGALLGGSATPNCTLGGSGTRTAPTLTWPTPAPVAAGTALSAAQLNATASVAGTYLYSPPAGTVLATAGTQVLSVTFTPTNATAYTTATKSVTLQVTSTGTFKGPASGGGWSGRISGGSLLYNGQTYPIVNGRVKFPDCTTYIVAPDGALLGGSATPNCALGGSSTRTAPTLTWPTPAPVAAGTALSAAQLNATASVAGTYLYSPPAGTVLATAGTQVLSVTFTPTNAAAYTTATKSVTLQVTSTGTFKGPASGGGWSGRISGGNLLYNGQTYPVVNGRVKFPDCTTYIVAPDGALLGGSATPNCTLGGSGTRTTPTLTWPTPAPVAAGTALSAAQLNATASVAGTYAVFAACRHRPGHRWNPGPVGDLHPDQCDGLHDRHGLHESDGQPRHVQPNEHLDRIRHIDGFVDGGWPGASRA